MTAHSLPTSLPEASEPVPILSNLMLLEWLRRAERSAMEERKMMFERLQKFETQQADRFAQHQKAIEHLLEERFDQVELLMNASTRHAGEVGSPISVAPANEAFDEMVPNSASAEALDEDENLQHKETSRASDPQSPPKVYSASDVTRAPRLRSHEIFNANSYLTHMPSATAHRLMNSPDTMFARCMQSKAALILVGCMILGNAVCSTALTTMGMKGVLMEPPQNNYAELGISIQKAYAIAFGVEVTLRILALRLFYFTGDDSGWNLFDLFLVICSLLEEISRDLSPLRVVRVFRFLRLFRIFRVLRLSPFFRELRMFWCSFSASLTAIMWATILVVLIIFICAVVFMQGLLSYIEELDPTAVTVFVEANSISKFYGSILDTMFSLCKSVSGGQPWYEIAGPLEDASELLLVLFCVYVFFIGFGVSSIIVSVAVNKTASMYAKDVNNTIADEADKGAALIKNMRALFIKAGWTCASITFPEFASCLDDSSIQLYLTSQNIEVVDALDVFENLEKDSPDVTFNEFAYGCLERRVLAKSTDVRHLRDDMKRVLSTSARIDGSVKAINTTLNSIASTLTNQFAIVRHELDELHPER